MLVRYVVLMYKYVCLSDYLFVCLPQVGVLQRRVRRTIA